MKDLFLEIYNSVRNNKLRTALTGFAVSWGIFLLICLLGTGNGITNAFSGNNDRFVANSMEIFGGYTTMPANGYKENRRINLDKGDLELALGGDFADNVESAAPLSSGISTTLAMGGKTVGGYIRGVTPDYTRVNKVNMSEGRFINFADNRDLSKVAVVSTTHLKDLGDDILGKWVTMQGFNFKVVGVYHGNESDFRSDVYIPYSTAKGIFDPSDKLGSLLISMKGINNLQESNDFEKRLGSGIKSRHEANPDDPGAIWIWNRFSQNAQMGQAQGILSLALWIIGLLTLISGIVGVSNIMLISVKERTHEFGIRKAVGARPGNILTLIISESVVITTIFGYIGMVLGMLACEILDKTVGQRSVDIGFDQIHMLENPTVGLDVAFEATLLLIVAGTLAGLIPARKAAKVKPIEALRAE